MELDHNSHSVFLLYYHLVMVIKYRRKVLNDEISERAKEIFEYIAPGYGIVLEEWNHDTDHVHVMAYKNTVDYCKEKGLVVIGDIKRGDIGSTSAAYAVGHLGKVQIGSKKYAGFDEDFATVNPYLGSDGVKPFIDVCKEENKGIFVLVKTSNPSSGEFQDRMIDGRPLYEWVV